MQIDKKVINALDSETRVKILKSLLQRRKMPSELSKELNLAASTILEHLDVLENAGLVIRKESGRKWIYYELTFKAESLIKPKIPIQFVLILSLGLILMIGGILNITYLTQQQFIYPIIENREVFIKTIPTMSTETTGTAGAPTQTETLVNNTTNIAYGEGYLPSEAINWIALTILIVGSVLFAIGTIEIVRRWSKLK